MFKRPGKIYDLEEARTKIRAFCSYQERSQHEVEIKLRSYGLRAEVAGELLVELIQEGFLSEERFTLAYVRGKFHQKRWGRIKIAHGLKSLRVPDPMIEKALNTIAEDEYLHAIRELALRKLSETNKADTPEERRRLVRFLQSRGFEYGQIKEVIDHLGDDQTSI